MLFLSIMAFSADRKEFDRIVDFSLSIKELDAIVKQERYDLLDPDKMVIIDGAVASITIVEENEDRFLAELEVINGEWEGLERVYMYSCLVQVSGKGFFQRIPNKAMKSPLKDEISQNARILVVGSPQSIRQWEDGTNMLVLDGWYIRTIK